MTEQETLRANVESIRARMADAARAAGRRPDEVLLCAASKTRSAETVRLAASLPIDLFGENRVQELVEKQAANAYAPKPAHFIGHLQTNKVKQVVGCDLIQSVDSEHLLSKIAAEAQRRGLVQPILLEVNIGGEESKSGIEPGALWALLEAAAAQPSVQVQGLMTIPPVEEQPGEARRWFAAMRRLFDEAADRWKGDSRVRMEMLSMGMSGDFEQAIAEGATLVRVGTAIFGPRVYKV
ncbi:YggS family pyridoxal phosphate enzyme [Gemmiger sp. An120]|uniref:YggS family pyridoxal phosphate-dependent enzyme n=1 Tax=Gemmiger sp. An120 TaxID=1965549 RepID=UPI000B576460|nr:YggS family pyridoxal phosphate-dependent enzyme [Gemmiger sp. An120]OUQ38367.1 YggS family pyridoxal phosphate enzyme [Gemmiger sp. An120]